MSSLPEDTRRAILVLLGAVALAIVLWVAVIAPKREESVSARERADAQQQRLDAANAKAGSYRAARASFAEHKRELRRLDRAVPGRGAVSELLRELQAEARRRGSDLRIVALKDPASAQGAVSPTPGAAAGGPGGLATLPFSLTFTGRYFDLVHLLRTVRRAVDVEDGDVRAKGRLLTIDGLTFNRPDRLSAVTTAAMNATAFVAGKDPKVPADPPATASTPGAP